MNELVDLHTHSYISDGACSPKELVRQANKNNVKFMALTDHDTIVGIKEAKKEAEKLNIKLINGIEISAYYKDGKMLHILGLGVDITNEEFLSSYYKMKKARHNGIPKLIKSIAELGADIDINVLKENSLDEYLSRQDLSKYLLNNNYCETSQQIWSTYLDPIPYGEDELISIEDTLKIIKSAGGYSFLAHYNKRIGLGGFNKEEMEEHIKYLICLGLDGLERYYPTFTKEDEIFLDYLIDKYNLKVCGGTDYHGEHRKGIDIGIGDGSFSVPTKVFKELFK